MPSFITCGALFDGIADEMQPGKLLEIDDQGRISGLSDAASAASRLVRVGGSAVVDHSAAYVVPGLIDIHVHLSYGNAKTEEDIDLYSSVELRALRGLLNAQRALAAGFTSIADPATTGRVSLAVRDAIEAGYFVGPRVSTSGRQITNRQGLSDWYPVWIGVPETSVGVLATTAEEGIREIRKQIKEGVDFIKIAIDGDTMNPFTGLISGYTQDELRAMIDETHRLGKQVVVHARGAQAVLYSARAAADVIFHASWMCEEGLEAVIKNGCKICPSLTFPFNNVELSTPSDPAYDSFVDGHKREIDSAIPVLANARKAGVEFLVGTDTGFAVTPYGEWHARELEIFVKHLGFTPAEALKCATRNNSRFLKEKGAAGTLAVGQLADFVVLKSDPLKDIRVLQDPRRDRCRLQEWQAGPPGPSGGGQDSARRKDDELLEPGICPAEVGGRYQRARRPCALGRQRDIGFIAGREEDRRACAAKSTDGKTLRVRGQRSCILRRRPPRRVAAAAHAWGGSGRIGQRRFREYHSFPVQSFPCFRHGSCRLWRLRAQAVAAVVRFPVLGSPSQGDAGRNAGRPVRRVRAFAIRRHCA